MPELNPTFMDEIRKTIESTRFSIDDFFFDGEEYGELIRVTFRYDEAYTFILSEEEKKEEVTSGTAYTLMSETISTSVTKLYSIESPGVYKKTTKVQLKSFDAVCGRVLKWCNNLHRELGSTQGLNQEIENAKRALKEQFEFSIEEPELRFTDNEITNLHSKLEGLYSKFEELSDKHQVSENELDKLRSEIDKMKESASTYKKGIWAKIAQNKITDLLFTLLKSKEGRELVFDSIKRIGS